MQWKEGTRRKEQRTKIIGMIRAVFDVPVPVVVYHDHDGGRSGSMDRSLA
jgi:hypothetical protein